MTVKIFIGTSPNNEDSVIERIYKYSLMKNTSSKLDITWMRLSNDKKSAWHGWNTAKWATPFSGFRWSIPHYCNFEGRAIYTDVDMINFRDINDLYNIDMKGKPFAARKGKRWGYEFCVMVIDCKIAKEHIWDIKKLKKKVMAHKIHRTSLSESNLVTAIDPRWNCLDGEENDLNDIYQLHFTNMSTQPWTPNWYKGKTFKHPRSDIVEYFNAMDEESMLAIEAGTFRPPEKSDDFVEYSILL